MKLDDCLLFVVGQPVDAWDPAVVLVRAAVVLLSTGKCRHGNVGPVEELLSRALSSLCPVIHIVDDLITGILGPLRRLKGSHWLF
ncbi:MAG: hypothetical protein RLZZ436_3798 [Planctomycetota bacterium]